ncbi:MAG: hypothetical protein IJT87_12510 [Ruminiclostridium sp.]|nr:hypothetical protein [Ruminiclostridium sp.]
MKIDDIDEISLLNKALLAAKFSDHPENDELAGSPTLAGLSNRVYEEMSRHTDKKVLNEAALEELRRIKVSGNWRKQWRSAVLTARRDPMFMSAGPEDRASLAKCYLSPFTCKEGELRAFIDEVDGKTGEHSLDKLFKEHNFTGAKLLDARYSLAKKQAALVLMLSSRKVCDICFSGVKKFEMSSPKTNTGDIPDMPALKRFGVSSASGQRFDGTFEGVSGKMILSVEALSVDCWL